MPVILGIEPRNFPCPTRVVGIRRDLRIKLVDSVDDKTLLRALRADWAKDIRLAVVYPDHDCSRHVREARSLRNLLLTAELIGRLAEVTNDRCHRYPPAAIAQRLLQRPRAGSKELYRELIGRYEAMRDLTRVDWTFVWAYGAAVCPIHRQLEELGQEKLFRIMAGYRDVQQNRHPTV